MIPATDIDIDTADRKRILELFNHTTAVIERNGKKLKHNTGVYFHKMPKDPFTGMATVDHKIAEDRGFFKIDVLNVGVYKDVRDPEHLQTLMDTDPQWDLLQHDEFTDMLFHVNGHGEILRRLKPSSIEQLAAVLAIIRPAKRQLLDCDWATIMDQVWIKPADDQYYFKKSHAIAYAHAVVVQMNLLCEDVVS
jgi:DNA polymerase III alpha subunit